MCVKEKVIYIKSRSLIGVHAVQTLYLLGLSGFWQFIRAVQLKFSWRSEVRKCLNVT